MSENEHKKIIECMKNGDKMIILRDGKMGFNLTSPFSFNETNHLTEVETENVKKVLALPDEIHDDAYYAEHKKRVDKFREGLKEKAWWNKE